MKKIVKITLCNKVLFNNLIINYKINIKIKKKNFSYYIIFIIYCFYALMKLLSFIVKETINKRITFVAIFA